MTDVSGKVQSQAAPKFASAQAASDSAQAEPDLHATIAALKAENQRLKAELADAHRQLSPQFSDLSPDPTPPADVPDDALPKPLLQELYDFIDQFTIGCAQANLVSGEYAFVNQAFCDMLGYSRAELMAMSFYDITHPDDCDRNQSLVQKHIHQPQPTYRLEKRYRHKNGHYVWVEVTVMSVQLPGGQCSPLGVIQDISDRKQAEAALLESQQRYQMASQAGECGVWDWNLVTNEMYVDPILKQILGYSDREIADRIEDWSSYIYAADQEKVAIAVQDYLDGRSPIFEVEHRMVAKNGEICWFLVRGTAVRDQQGCPCRLTGTDTNITAFKRTEQQLQQQQASLQAMFEQAGVGFALVHMTGQYQKVNQKLCELTGYREAELLQMNFQAVTHPEDLAADEALVERLLAGEMNHFVLEKRFLRANGQSVWTRLTASLIRDKLGQPRSILGIVEDIHERIQAEALQQAYLRDLNTWRNRYEAASQASGQILYEWDLEADVAVYGANTERILGYANAEMPAAFAEWLQLVHPDDRQRIHQETEQTLQQGKLFHLDYRVRHHDGHYIWIEDNCRFFTDSRNSIHRLVGAIQDISDRKQIEEELRRSREMLQAVIDNVPQRIFWKDVNSVYLGCNQSQAKAAGLASPEQIIGLRDRDLPWTTAQSEAYRADDAIVIQSDQPLHHVLEVQRQSNGQIRWLDGHKIPLHDAHGRVIGLVGTAEDITGRKQAEELLVLQAQRERTLNHVVYAIRNSLNLADIFSTAVREVGHFLNMDWVKVVHYDAEQAVWRVVEAYQRLSPESSHPAIVGTEIPDAHAPFSAWLKRGQIIKLDSVSLDSIPSDSVSLNSLSLDSILQNNTSAVENKIDPAIAQQFPGGWLIMPIRLGDQTWGSLTLMRSHQQMQWSIFDVELAQAIAAQLAIAIQQSELYQQVNQLNITLEQEVRNRTAQLQQAVDFEALLKRITDRVRDSLNETQILNTVVQELVHGLGALSCDSGRYDLDTQTSTIAYEYVDAESTFTPLDDIVCPMANFPHVYQQLLRGKSLQLCWIPERNLLRPFQQPCTALACPIIDDQGVIGDLWLYRAAGDHFNEMEVRLAEQVANQCAIAVRQARLYQAAQAQVDELARLNQLKDDFLSTVSHELRTPMSSIQMAVQMLEITFERLGLQFAPSSPVANYLHILQSECNREISLINDLLDLSRLEAEVEPLELMPIELNLWLSHIAEPFLERTRQQQQQLLLDLPASLPTIVTDLSYLERTITELLHNACKYTPPGETIQVAAQVQADLTHVQINVINTGITIPDAECDRIFDKFYRIPNGDPWKHGGTGLGLALVKKLVERLDGSIALANPANHVIFQIQLPLCHSHALHDHPFSLFG